jgi:hypothetical protein
MKCIEIQARISSVSRGTYNLEGYFHIKDRCYANTFYNKKAVKAGSLAEALEIGIEEVKALLNDIAGCVDKVDTSCFKEFYEESLDLLEKDRMV